MRARFNAFCSATFVTSASIVRQPSRADDPFRLRTRKPNSRPPHTAAVVAARRANFSIKPLRESKQFAECGKIPFYVLTAMSKSYSNSGSAALLERLAHEVSMTQCTRSGFCVFPLRSLARRALVPRQAHRQSTCKSPGELFFPPKLASSNR